ncbi:MAG: flagellar biosynthesis repressor FlbT [Siculibacillus sp.]|nr:flagellar biosynthesis repressor FlbT [Siculibacillus sp.]
MSLKVELKPGEKIIIGESLITNDHQRTRLFIEGNAPILREKDILSPSTADTPAKRIYLIVQLMYLARNVEKLQDEYFTAINEFILASPSSIGYITDVSKNILSGNLYKALKGAKLLIEHERRLIDHVSASGTGLSSGQ